MARVNLEDRAFGDQALTKLANEILRAKYEVLDLARCGALGIVSFLWHESQGRGVVDATAEEIDRWTGFDGMAPLLAKCGYVSPTSEGKFRIHGNAEQLSGIKSWVDQRAEAGRRSAEARKARYGSSQPERTSNDRSNEPERARTTVERNSNDAERDRTQDQIQDQIQDQKIDTKKKDRGTGVPPRPASPGRTPPKTADGTKVWEAYSLAMEVAWGTTPPKSAKTATCAKKLVDLVGIEKAIELAAYYPSRRKGYYVERGHPFELLVSDHMALLRELGAGLKLTPEIVKDIVSKEQSENYIRAEQMGIVNTDPFGLPVGTEEEVRRLGKAHP